MRLAALVAALAAALAVNGAEPRPGPEAFAREVELRLEVPPPVQAEYAARLEAALAGAGIGDPAAQYFVLVDRSARVQAGFVYWRSPEAQWRFIGASPVSTGRPGEYEHFLTPLGAFVHPGNMDFRAEGTPNALGILGYGRKGMRVFDFGWVVEERAWGQGGSGLMRLQMHATDPRRLEPLLGERRHSKGCIRIAASLNTFIDRHGLLDADYEAAARAGKAPWVLRPDREPTPWPGRWLVVVESERTARPEWARKKARLP